MKVNKYVVGKTYTRTEIRNIENDPGTQGKWDGGYVEHNNEMFILSTYGGESYTGVDHGDKWIDDETFFWNGRQKSNINHKLIKKLLDPGIKNHLFVRKSNSNKNKLKGAPFTYKGWAVPIKVSGKDPINIIWKVNSEILPFIEIDDISETRNIELDYSNTAFSTEDTITLPEKERIKKSARLKKECLASHNYQCEINPLHETFISSKTNRNYMETHHIIPLSAQRYYKNKLDCTAKMSCLCPTCHRSIHYGKKEDKLPLLKQIYEKHIDDIIKSGIEIESLESVLLYY